MSVRADTVFELEFNMKITTLIAAAALATASTAAVAENVTTEAGEIVMIEKNQASLPLLLAAGPAAFVAIIVAASKSNEGT